MFDHAQQSSLFHTSRIYQFKRVFHNLQVIDASVRYIHVVGALESPQRSRHIVHLLEQIKRDKSFFSGFDFMEDPREELSGALTGDTLAAPLDGVVLLADITLIAAANIFKLLLINNL